MERAENLKKLRGDGIVASDQKLSSPKANSDAVHLDKETFDKLAKERFAPAFQTSAPLNAQKLILLCLRRSASDRPSADALLSVSDFLLTRFCLPGPLTFLTFFDVEWLGSAENGTRREVSL